MKTDEMRQRSTEKQGKTTNIVSETANKQRNAVQTTAQARPHKKTVDSWAVQARRQSRGRSAGWPAGRPAGRPAETMKTATNTERKTTKRDGPAGPPDR